jgi:hypothetical protein
MTFLRIVTQRGSHIHHFNSDITIEEFEKEMEKGKPFVVPYKEHYRSRIVPDEVIVWNLQELHDGCKPTFQY